MCQKTKLAVKTLRERFFDLNIHAIVIPSTDPHQSEYLCNHWKMRQWISGFTGSAGTIVITREKAGLWTDSRYFLQAEQELEESEFKLFKQGLKETPSINDFLKTELSEGNIVALNHKIWSQDELELKRNSLYEVGIEISIEHQPVEQVWNKLNRPELPKGEIFQHQELYVGASIQEKLAKIRLEMKGYEVDRHLITTLDDIAWLLNLRGNDVDFNPVFLSYVVVEDDQTILFIDPKKIDAKTKCHLENQGVFIKDYEDITSYLAQVDRKILVNPKDCNGYLYQCISSDLIVHGMTITRLLKACKNSKEISHIENAMIKDGVALAKAFHHLFQNIGAITEAEFAMYIAQMRNEQLLYYGESFPAIVGYQSNGAIVHYRPQLGKSALIKATGLLLCDSGGQYQDGTTDITRTVAVGPVTPQQKVDYTNVLKGHIAIDQTIFPEGTTGGELDSLARQFLWKSGKNFGHGTGHGVGYFLNVHEPPQGISPGNGIRSITPFQIGMITSNEPGYYEDSSYGIRLENLVVCEASEHEGYLRHRHLTLFPFDTSLLVQELLTQDEVDWINKYHDLVQEKVTNHLPIEIKSWFRGLCQKI